MDNLTPMMKQYMKIKLEHKDSILFFRLGDFYEMFFEDAIIASKELEIALTQRDSGLADKAPMCGIPHHVADNYISRLVEKGYKVAICDQLEDPALAKGIVKRDVVKIITPGTITDSTLLDDKTNNFLLSLFIDELGVGLTYVDNSTGEMYTTEHKGSLENNYKFVLDELGKIMPSEIICNNDFIKEKKYINIIENNANPYISTYINENISDIDESRKTIRKLFTINNLDDIGIDKKIYSLISTSKLIEYLYNTQKNSLDHISNLSFYEADQYMAMDFNTRINLEINETIRSKSKKGALISIMDKTLTSMGGRLLKKYLEQPLLNSDNINYRLDIVGYYYNNLIELEDIRSLLKDIYDIERLTSKISNGNCNGKDLIFLKISISKLPDLKEKLIGAEQNAIRDLGQELDVLSDIYNLIDRSINNEPPLSIKDGNIIKRGYDKTLDELLDASHKGKVWLSDLESKEKNNTGIKNLKVGFNRVFGYYIEVTKSNLNMVPDYFIRKQTLANSERYFTEELKKIETSILHSEEKSLELEYKLFQDIRQKVKEQILRLQKVSKYVAIIDVLTNFAYIANKNNYIRPNINNDGIYSIEEGRHPVVESTISNNLFIPNDTYMDMGENLIQIITGPNMAGKSTYMRQIAIITILAQIGSFVPAKNANVSIVDSIFTRIGASDNLAQGESTFMVEMNEVSNILKSATDKSLIILDEVGRGTSTYDGLSIAWAVVEHIATKIKAKTLFATHYHELTQLSSKFNCIKNMTILAEEIGDDIVFLRKIAPGSTNRSYGIQVAKLAGIDKAIIKRANEILYNVEGTHDFTFKEKKAKNNKQLSLLEYKKDYYLDRIINVDINNLTPIDALNLLSSLIDDAKNIKESN